MPLILIHKRKSSLPAGTITDDAGVMLGAARPVSKIAAGTGGQRRRFYSAEVLVTGPQGQQATAYIGTRYGSRAQAVRAVRDFHAEYPPERINALAASLAAGTEPEQAHWLIGSQHAFTWAVYKCTGCWKRDHAQTHPFNVQTLKEALA